MFVYKIKLPSAKKFNVYTFQEILTSIVCIDNSKMRYVEANRKPINGVWNYKTSLES